MLSRRPPSDFNDELAAHLAHEIDRLRAEGFSEQEASQRARRNLGNLASARERFFESRRWLWLDHLSQDTRHSLRRLWHAPAFTVTAILTLALGIGATSAIFTLIHAIMLKSLPVSNPSQLYRVGKELHCCVWGGFTQEREFSIFSHALYEYLRDHTENFEEMAAFQAGGTLVGVRRAASSNPAQSYAGEYVSGNYFAMFGVSAFAGRTLTPTDDRPGAAPAAMMSYAVWQRKFGLDPSILGAAFNINDKPFTVVGVTPPSFYGDTLRSTSPDFFLPLAAEPVLQAKSSILRDADQHWLEIIGRARPGATSHSIEARMRVALAQWLHSHEGEMEPNERTLLPKQTLYLSPGGAGIISMREQYQEWLRILMIVSAFVLLIVCANVANLMLVRGLERRQQTSLSMALGANPMRMVRQALTESILLSLLGGGAGLAVAFAGTRLILHFAFDSNAAIGAAASPIGASPSLPVLLFTLAVALFTGIVFGIAPAWMASRADPIEALRGANRSTRHSASLPRKTLVILQAALSLVLLSASGLLAQALRHLEHQDFGFDQDRRMVVNIDPVIAGYKPAQLDSLFRRIHDSFASLPGVASVGLALYSPMNGASWNDWVFVEGRPAPASDADQGASWSRVSAGFFETIANPVIQGRALTEQDTPNSRRVVVVNEAFVKKFFKNQNPIGKRFGRGDIKHSADYQIVGVAKDARYLTYNLDKPAAPFFFAPATQWLHFEIPRDDSTERRSHFLHDIVIQMKPGAQLTEPQARRAIASVDPNLPLIAMRTMREQVAGNFGQQRLIANLTSLFGLLALVLASIGLYGVTAYSVGSRTDEIGVRMALGASRRSVVSMILRGAFVLTAFGLAIGVPLTLAAAKLLGSQLYGINPYDPIIVGIAVVALSFSAFIAAVIPAFRASSISPMQALRAE